MFGDFFPFSPTAPAIGPILSLLIYRGDDMMFEKAFGLGCPTNSNRHSSPQSLIIFFLSILHYLLRYIYTTKKILFHVCK